MAGTFIIADHSMSHDMAAKADDFVLATMMRIDPERLAALKRSMTGKTRCPHCDELNPAENRYCLKCGRALYPDQEAKRRETSEGDSEGPP